MNKYLKVSLTLALIAGGAATLIGLMNMLTEDIILKNKDKKIANGLSEILLGEEIKTYVPHDFSEKGEDGYEERFDSSLYPLIKTFYEVTTNDEKTHSIYSTTGKNAYGQIDLLVLVEDLKVSNIYAVTNTETYGQTLEDNYISKFNNGYATLGDVKCGATYGAKTVKEECDQALAHYMKWIKEGE